MIAGSCRFGSAELLASLLNSSTLSPTTTFSLCNIYSLFTSPLLNNRILDKRRNIYNRTRFTITSASLPIHIPISNLSKPSLGHTQLQHNKDKSVAMADCGPSNPLQTFQKQSTTDRTLHQDRLVSRPSLSQVSFASAQIGPQLTSV